MARLEINDKDLLIVSSDSGILYTDWVVFDKINDDGSPGNLLFASVKDYDNVFSIIATLRYPNGDLYPPEEPTVGIARLHTSTTTIPYVFSCCGDRPTPLPEDIPYKLLSSLDDYLCNTPDVDNYIDNLS